MSCPKGQSIALIPAYSAISCVQFQRFVTVGSPGDLFFASGSASNKFGKGIVQLWGIQNLKGITGQY